MEETLALMYWQSIPGIGIVRLRQLINFFGSAAEAWKRPLDELKKISGFNERVIQSISEQRCKSFVLKEFESISEVGVQMISYLDERYPKRFLSLDDAPLLIYASGNAQYLQGANIAVVGTRKPSRYGKEIAHDWSCAIGRDRISIVSGCARGIDTQAHIGALKGGNTLAVLGSGIRHFYPPENKGLILQIMEKGCVVTEYAPWVRPDRFTFPRRNRLISGLSDAVLIVEAPVNSGSLITAEYALSQGKPLFVVPGRLEDETFSGNQYLLKSGKGKLITSAEELVIHLGIPLSNSRPRIKSGELGKEEQKLYDRIPNVLCSFDQIVHQLQMTVQDVNVFLMRLVLKKLIKEFPGKNYKKLSDRS